MSNFSGLEERSAAERRDEKLLEREKALATFQVDQALNRAGFLEFLAKYQDAGELGRNTEADKEKFFDRFEAFQRREVLSADLKQLYSREVKTHAQLDLTPEELGFVDQYLDRLSIDNAAKIKELSEIVASLKSQQTEIPKLEKGLRDLVPEGKTLEEFIRSKASEEIAAREKLEQAGLKLKRSWRPPLFRAGLKAKVEDARGIHDKLVEELAGIQDLAAKRETMQQVLDEARSSLFGGALPAEELNRLSIKKTGEILNGFKTKLTSLDQAELAQQYYEQILATTASGLTGVRYLDPKFDREKYQRALDQAIETQTKKTIKEIVKNSNLGNGALDRFLASLASVTQREHVGTKNPEQLKAFVSETLKTLQLKSAPAQQILINVALTKLNTQ